jgi:CRP-like cAMP-binding protein
MVSILKIFDKPTGPVRTVSLLSRRIGAILSLTDEDRQALAILEANPCGVGKSKVLIEMSGDGTRPVVLLSGFVVVSRSSSSGERLIIDPMIPGDLGKLRSIVLERANIYFDSISDVAISRFHPKTYYELLMKQPRLGTTLMLANAVDRSLLAERLLQYWAPQRLSAPRLFFLELLMRKRRAGIADGNMFHAPLTLAIFGDLPGMTFEHVSRLMQRLRRCGSVKAERDCFAFSDMEGMAKACDFDPLYLHLSDHPEEKQNDRC